MRQSIAVAVLIFLVSIPVIAQQNLMQPIPLDDGWIAVPRGGFDQPETPLAYFEYASNSAETDYLQFGDCRLSPFRHNAPNARTGVAIYVQHRQTLDDPAPGAYQITYHNAGGERLAAGVVEYAPDLEVAQTTGGGNYEGVEWFYIVTISAECVGNVEPMTRRAWLPVVRNATRGR